MPSNTTFRVFYYLNVAGAIKDSKYFIGYLNNIIKRLVEHEDAKRHENVQSTPNSRLLVLRLLECQRQSAFGTESWYTGYGKIQANHNLFSGSSGGSGVWFLAV